MKNALFGQKKILENRLPTDETRVTPDRPDEWAKIWSLTRAAFSPCVRCQQGSGEVTFWAIIINDKLIEPFRAPESEKHIS